LRSAVPLTAASVTGVSRPQQGTAFGGGAGLGGLAGVLVASAQCFVLPAVTPARSLVAATAAAPVAPAMMAAKLKKKVVKKAVPKKVVKKVVPKKVVKKVVPKKVVKKVVPKKVVKKTTLTKQKRVTTSEPLAIFGGIIDELESKNNFPPVIGIVAWLALVLKLLGGWY